MADSLNKKKNGSSAGETTPATESTVSISDIEKLFSLMRENEIAELEIETTHPEFYTQDYTRYQPVLDELAAERDPLYREVADLGFDTGEDAASAAAGRLAGILRARWQRDSGKGGPSVQAHGA